MTESTMRNPFLMPRRQSTHSSSWIQSPYSSTQSSIRKPGFLIKMNNYDSDVVDSSPLLKKPNPFQTVSSVSHNNYHHIRQNPFYKKNIFQDKIKLTTPYNDEMHLPAAYFYSYYQPNYSYSQRSSNNNPQSYVYSQPIHYSQQPFYSSYQKKPYWNSQKKIQSKSQHYAYQNTYENPHDMSFERKKLPTHVYTSVNLTENNKYKPEYYMYSSQSNHRDDGQLGKYNRKFQNQPINSGQILKQKEINYLYQTAYQNLRDSISMNSLKRESEQQKAYKIRNMFQMVVNQFQKQYQTTLQKDKENQFAKIKPILGEAYTKMYSTSLGQKRQGKINEVKYEQGKRLFAQVCNGIFNKLQQQNNMHQQKMFQLNLNNALKQSIQNYAYEQRGSIQPDKPSYLPPQTKNMNYPSQLTYKQKIFSLI